MGYSREHRLSAPKDFSPREVELLRSAVREELEPLWQELQAMREELQSRSIEDEAPLDAKDAAKRLNISLRKLDELVADRQIRPLRIGQKRLFPREQLDSFLRNLARSR